MLGESVKMNTSTQTNSNVTKEKTIGASIHLKNLSKVIRVLSYTVVYSHVLLCTAVCIIPRTKTKMQQST